MIGCSSHSACPGAHEHGAGGHLRLAGPLQDNLQCCLHRGGVPDTATGDRHLQQGVGRVCVCVRACVRVCVCELPSSPCHLSTQISSSFTDELHQIAGLINRIVSTAHTCCKPVGSALGRGWTDRSQVQLECRIVMYVDDCYHSSRIYVLITGDSRDNTITDWSRMCRLVFVAVGAPTPPAGWYGVTAVACLVRPPCWAALECRAPTPTWSCGA